MSTSYWLLEAEHTCAPVYLARTSPGFTTDASEAVRFDSEDAAESARRNLRLPDEWTAQEHADHAPPAAPKLYPEHDPRALEPYFSRHMQAMTAERLDSKADIAEQLAARDKTIDELRERLRTLGAFQP